MHVTSIQYFINPTKPNIVGNLNILFSELTAKFSTRITRITRIHPGFQQ